ncbi:MAG: DUF6279 family lipoprotein [Limnohabitans sp.]|jgi:hypothetical protein
MIVASRYLLALLVLLALQGCSAIKLGYQQLPTLSYWWLDSTVSFSSEQSVRAKEALEQLHQWHRREELPRYVSFLQNQTQWSQNAAEPVQLCNAFAEAQNRMDRLMREAVRQAAPVALLLGPRQLSHMARQWDKKNEDWEKDWLRGDDQARMERRVERVTGRYSDFYGTLSAEQTALIRTQLAQSPWTAEWGRQDRQRRQQDLLATLQRVSQSQMSVAQAEAELWGVWQRWLKPSDPVGAALMQAMSQQACNNLSQLHNSTTAEQRQRATRRIRAYERDLRDLLLP